VNSIINDIDLSKLPQVYMKSHPELVELYNFAWKKAAENIRECNGQRYMDCAWDFTRNFQWVWDTCFMTLYARYDNGGFPGISSLDNFYKFQRSDGFIAMTYDLNTGKEVYGERINPPLFAWCEWEYYKTTGDMSRFEKVIPKIEKLMKWIDANRRCESRSLRQNIPSSNEVHQKGGKQDKQIKSFPFYYFNDGGSSGMDDSPRAPRLPEAGKFYDWIDLSSQMVLSFRMLANMHSILNNDVEKNYWNTRGDELADAINSELWCDRTGFYHDRIPGTNFVNSKTIAGFWPIIAGIANGNKLKSLINYLQDEKTFNRPIPVPSLSADDCNYCENGTYWIGGVWAPTNYMVTRGLMYSGNGDLAYDIAAKYLNGLQETFNSIEPHSLWECYNPEKPFPGRNAYDRLFVKPDFVGWSGIGPIAMLIENILGIELNAPEKQIDWTIRLNEAHGIKKLKLADVTVDLECDFSDEDLRTPLISIKTDSDITVNIKYNDKHQKLSLKKGEIRNQKFISA